MTVMLIDNRSYFMGRKGLYQHDRLSLAAYHQTRGILDHLGNLFCSPPTTRRCLSRPLPGNPVRHLPLEARFQYHDLRVSVKTIQFALAMETNVAQWSKQACIQEGLRDSIGEKSSLVREFVSSHMAQDFWRYMVFIDDDAPLDPASRAQGHI